MKEKIIAFLRWSQKFTKTDMVYVVSGGFWWILGKTGILFIGFFTMIAFELLRGLLALYFFLRM